MVDPIYNSNSQQTQLLLFKERARKNFTIFRNFFFLILKTGNETILIKIKITVIY